MGALMGNGLFEALTGRSLESAGGMDDRQGEDVRRAARGWPSVSDAYYEEELLYLREEGARFARTHPQRAGYLNLESAKDRDPAVERLFEGFAFLCAGIRRRLDDGFPELTEGLAEMLWPQFLEPVPGTCIAAFKPRAGMLHGSHIIKKGTDMYTPPDPDTGVACRFSTAWDVNVNPLSLDKVEISANTVGKDILTLAFKLDPGIRPDALRLSRTRVYIHDDLSSALLIRKLLLRDVEAITLRDDRGQSLSINPRDMFIEGGFGENDGLFPECQNVSRPFSLLRDYFTFPERFLFVDICGLDLLPRSAKPPSVLYLEVRFDRKIPGHIALAKSTFRLYCTPAVNIFRRDAEPVAVSGEKSEYRLIPDSARPGCYAIQSVESVTGIDSATGERREYNKFGKFGGLQRFYSLRRDRLPDGGPAIKILMNGRQTENGRLIRETLHIETWQTNGTLARKAAAAGNLRLAAPNFPDFITFSNITLPNNPINPPSGDEFLWTFLSHLSCAHSNFCDAGKLKDFLYAYDWTGNKRPEAESILSVSLKPIDLAEDMAVIRGTEMNIAIDERAAPEEALFLFGTVVARALSCMASVNTFLKLTFTMSPSGKQIVWYCRSGERRRI
jgi:type VI secretion system protein ImpG